MTPRTVTAALVLTAGATLVGTVATVSTASACGTQRLDTGRVSMTAPAGTHVRIQTYSKHASYVGFAHPVKGGYATSGLICASAPATADRCTVEIDDLRVLSSPVPVLDPTGVQGFSHSTGVVCELGKGDTVTRTTTTETIDGQRAVVATFDTNCESHRQVYELWHFAGQRVDVLATGAASIRATAAVIGSLRFR